MPQNLTVRRLSITVRGVVQGVGFRPFVYNAASAAQLSGWVLNDAEAVRIEVEGPRDALDGFLKTLEHDCPPQAHIEGLEICESSPPAAEFAAGSFKIRHSANAAAPRPTIPADLASCADCLAEIRDPAQRRYRYPFTNCTNCGPRWSIIEQLPYDRPRTSMSRFAMCDRCRAEYEDPADRRFHAQPIACPDCGPQLELLDSDGYTQAAANEALAEAAKAILDGKIMALKGLGGFQLIVDATCEAAVARLRQRKGRPDKPLALVLPSLEEVRRRCIISETEAAALVSHQAPIVLLRRRLDHEAVRDVAANIAPDNPYLGVMLPYTPLHHLLLDDIARPVVCTSGNLSEEPMAIETTDACRRLGPIADLILTHNRPIVRPVDDSVARVSPDGLQLLRRARGFAPLPIKICAPEKSILATGGHLKNTVALSLGSDVIISPHIGDLDNTLSVEVQRRTVTDLIGFYDLKPAIIACDMHPDYASTRHAERLSDAWDAPLIRVQHHHAHVASCMAEHQLEGPVLGLSWDGTGYGSDGSVWGGEALLCEGAEFTRVAHLRTFSLPGGDQVAREPRRAALGMLHEFLGAEAAEHVVEYFTPAELRLLTQALARDGLFPRSSSMGRLFDAVAALCALAGRVSFEGQAAMALEFAADPAIGDAYPFPLSDDTPAVADWEPMLRAIIADRSRGTAVARIAARFHNALIEMALTVVQRANCRQVALTGGCCQNALLADRLKLRLSEAGYAVYTQLQVPPGDGGLALGQIFIAAGRAQRG